MNTYTLGTNKLDDSIKQSIKEHKTSMVLKNKHWVYNPHANSIITTVTLEEFADVRQLVEVEDRYLQLKYNSEYQTYIFPIGDEYGIFKTIDTNSIKDIYVKLDERQDRYSDCSNTNFIDTNSFCIDAKSYIKEEEMEKLKPNRKYVPHMENYYNNTHGMYIPLYIDHELFKQLWCDSYVAVIHNECDMFMLPDETPANYRVSTDIFDLSITINKPSYKLINIANPDKLTLYKLETEINKSEYDNIMFIYGKIKQKHDRNKVCLYSSSRYPRCDIVNNSCYEKDGKFYIQFTKFMGTCELLQEIHLRFTYYANKFSISTINSCFTGDPIKDSPKAEIVDCLPKK